MQCEELYSSDGNKEEEIVGTRVTYRGEQKCIQGFGGES